MKETKKARKIMKTAKKRREKAKMEHKCQKERKQA